jgi:hypothetical protein
VKKIKVLLILSVFFCFSCKKQKLEGDSEILIGKWNWIYSSEVNNTCNPPTWVNTLNPANQNVSFSIEFIKKGKVIFYENSVASEKFRIKDLLFDKNNFHYTFSMIVNSEDNNNMSGLVTEDTLIMTQGFPFYDTQCEDYANRFIRD